MNPKQPVKPFLNIAQNEKYPNIIDANLLIDKDVLRYDRLHCHFVVYPFARKISSENIAMHPFAEYSKDISNRRSSVYSEIRNSAPQFFGLFLVAILLIIVFILAQYEREIKYTEIIISLFGVYMIGKDFWQDIEGFLERITKNRNLKYQDPYYAYELQKNTTMMRYSNLAKKERYGYSTILPERMDYLIASNSCTIRLLFDVEDFTKSNTERSHIFSVRITPTELMDELAKYGYMMGVKIALSKVFFGIEHGYEMFQSIKNKEAGSLNDESEWLKDAVVVRKFWSIGKIFYRSKIVCLEQRKLVDFNLP